MKEGFPSESSCTFQKRNLVVGLGLDIVILDRVYGMFQCFHDTSFLPRRYRIESEAIGKAPSN